LILPASAGRSFRTSPGAIAAEEKFYRLTQCEPGGHGPLAMEKQLSEIEGEVSLITDQWLSLAMMSGHSMGSLSAQYMIVTDTIPRPRCSDIKVHNLGQR
jgi:hypothetical protein